MSRRKALVAALSTLVLLATAGLLGGLLLSSQSTGTDPHGTALPSARRVQLSFTMPAPSSFDGLHAKLVNGTMPTAVTSATVLSDEQCQPDAMGISHCLNRMRLPSGSELAVRHPHDMSDVPCLAPGEEVQLVPPRTA
jgi:hypothetical protein